MQGAVVATLLLLPPGQNCTSCLHLWHWTKNPNYHTLGPLGRQCLQWFQWSLWSPSVVPVIPVVLVVSTSGSSGPDGPHQWFQWSYWFQWSRWSPPVVPVAATTHGAVVKLCLCVQSCMFDCFCQQNDPQTHTCTHKPQVLVCLSENLQPLPILRRPSIGPHQENMQTNFF